MNIERYYNGQPITKEELSKIIISNPTIEIILKDIEGEFHKHKKDSKKSSKPLDNIA